MSLERWIASGLLSVRWQVMAVFGSTNETRDVRVEERACCKGLLEIDTFS